MDKILLGILIEKDSEPGPLVILNKDLAERVGCSAVTIKRALPRLEDLGLISRDKIKYEYWIERLIIINYDKF